MRNSFGYEKDRTSTGARRIASNGGFRYLYSLAFLPPPRFQVVSRRGVECSGSQHESHSAPLPPPFSIVGFVLSPCALWVYSFTAALVLIWSEQRASYRIVWLAMPSLLALGGEFGQMFHIVPGTFDWSDVTAYLIAGLSGFLLPSGTLSTLHNLFRKGPHAIEQAS